MANSSLITLTEVGRNYRTARLHESGWKYFNARLGHDSDDCAICWRVDTWHRKDAFARKITTVRYTRPHATKPAPPTWCVNALLKHVQTDKTLLVSVAHMPAHIEGHWKNPGTPAWRARKEAYTDAMQHWSTLIQTLQRRMKPSATLVVADWNLDLKDQWVREYLGSHWNRKCGLRRAWVDFPTSGGSLGGNRIIDGSYYDGLEVTDGPNLGPRVRSSDHRPYGETFKLTGAVTQTGPKEFYDPATGHIKKGVAWWGFGDYAYDEMFEVVTVQDDGSTVVTFDFEELPY